MGPGRRATATSRRTGPITVGLLVADYTKAGRSVGYRTSGLDADPAEPFRHLVTAMNAHGGLAGRRIEPVFYSMDGMATDYDTEAEAACAAFTQDHHVEVVLSMNAIFDVLSTCLTRAGVAHYDGGSTQVNDATGLRAFPGQFSVGGMRTDRSVAAVIDQSARTGWLTSKNRLGVLVEACPDQRRNYSNVVVPRARRLGIPVERIELTCFNGYGQAGEMTSQISSAVLKMRSVGVDRVMYLGLVEGVINQVFANEASSQRWYPGYVLSTNALVQINQPNIPVDQLVNMYGVGWMPMFDVPRYPDTAAAQRCRALNIAGGGRTPTTLLATIALYSSCDPLFLVEDSLRANGGFGGLTALRAATESLGATYAAVTALGGQTRYGPGQHDGAQGAAPFSFKKNCTCFSYDARPVRA